MNILEHITNSIKQAKVDLDGDSDIYLSARVKWRCNTHDALMYFKNNTLQ